MKNRIVGVLVLVFLIGFLLLAFISYGWGEAKVLGEGTVITMPDGTVQTLSASHFLLDRTDMEQATYAMQTLPIDEKTIADLRALSDKQTQAAKDRGTVEAVSAVLIAILAALLGYALK